MKRLTLSSGTGAGGIWFISALATAPVLQVVLRLGSIWPVLWVALYCLPIAAVVVPWGWLCGQGRFRAVGCIAVTSAAVRLGAGVLFVRAGWGVSGAVAASVAA